jgi:hypothetical protein
MNQSISPTTAHFSPRLLILIFLLHITHTVPAGIPLNNQSWVVCVAKVMMLEKI